jgi:hypothetical protein
MSARGKRWAFLIGAVIAFSLPKKVDRGQHPGPRGYPCTAYEVEPWGFYLIEYVVSRPVGFAYSSDEDCR